MMDKTGSGCLPRGIKISTPAGLQDISTIDIGESVYAVEPTSGAIAVRTVLSTCSYSNRRLFSVYLSDGIRVQATSSHSFDVNGQWKTTSQLNVGDAIRHYDGVSGSTLKTITKIQLENESVDVFNLVVDRSFTFLANGALVHCFTYLRRLRSYGWIVYSLYRRFRRSPEVVVSAVGRLGRT